MQSTNNSLTGSDLYILVSNMLLGYKMDKDLFYQLLGLTKGNREQSRSWNLLKAEDQSQNITPAQNTIGNSLYLTPLVLPADFINFYSPKRSLVLAASDGITFRYYSQIPVERKQEYKDDNTKFYLNLKTSQIFLCGTLDRNYTVHQYYIANSPEIDENTPWIFPARFHPILACDVAQWYRENFDYDVVNVNQADRIANLSRLIFSQMTEWDGSLQEMEMTGVDYQMLDDSNIFRNGVVGDNNSY